MNLTGKAIWFGDKLAKDVYVDFAGNFSYESGKVFLRISCDSNFVARLNGQIVGFGACADYPTYRQFYKFDITPFCRRKNNLEITVWHYGADSSTYISAPAFLLFEVVEQSGGSRRVLMKSGKNILARQNAHYANGRCQNITSQLGFGFAYDTTAEENAFDNACELGIVTAHQRKTKPIKLLSRASVKLVRKPFGYLVDFEKERVGYLDLSFVSHSEQNLTIIYGEHFDDFGRVPRIIGERDFSVEYRAKIGKNEYTNLFRRLAGRYLEIICENEIEITYAGLRVVKYPTLRQKHTFENPLDNAIYQTSVYTLECCMHEHYEDCPWREQAMYTMDSRNQMLCGYYAFRSATYQREMLLHIARGQRPDGFLPICFPAGLNLPIPFFSLVFVMQVFEYVEHTGDRKILGRLGKPLEKLMDVFYNRIDPNGLIANLHEPFWNFYEWSDGNTGWDDDKREGYDLILNCMFVYVAKLYSKLTGKTVETQKTEKAIVETFYDAERGLFRSFDVARKDKNNFCVLGNSLAVLAGVGNEAVAEKLIKEKNLVPVTLSMATFFYDALLLFGDKWKDFVSNDIRTKYKKMLDDGATTFWETEEGWRAFDNAGSLCHGWSAMPVFYLSRINKTF